MISGLMFREGVVVVITIGLSNHFHRVCDHSAWLPYGTALNNGKIAIVLAGAFPMVNVITKVFKKPLMSLGKAMGMNDVAAAGIVATLANNIPMFQIMHDMDYRGKVLNVAFAVSAAFTFGDHLGFTAGVAKEMIFPMIVGKLLPALQL